MRSSTAILATLKVINFQHHGASKIKMTPEEYLEKRLQDQIDWYNRKSVANQKIFKRLRLAEIVAAALIPFLSGVMLGTDRYRLAGTVIVGLLGVMITIITGILSLGRHQENWIEYRATCESLQKEKFLFETGVDPYHDENRFPLLVQKSETLLSKENANWTQYMLKPAEGKTERKS